MTWRRAFAGILASEMADGVVELASTWRPDLVVHEDSEQGSWIAAERIGVPHVALQATAWRGNSYRLSADPLNVVLAAHGLPEDPDLARWHRFGFLTTRPPALHNPDDPMPAGTRPIRHTASDEAGGEPVTWPTAARDGRSRVVVTMGTLMPGRPETMTAILDGLEPLGRGHHRDGRPRPRPGRARPARDRRRGSCATCRCPRSWTAPRCSCSTAGRGRCSPASRPACRWSSCRSPPTSPRTPSAASRPALHACCHSTIADPRASARPRPTCSRTPRSVRRRHGSGTRSRRCPSPPRSCPGWRSSRRAARPSGSPAG